MLHYAHSYALNKKRRFQERLELIGAPTPLEYLPRLSDHLGREIFIKRDDTTPG
jgi:1-aminocyclopropane-1-carboxylate deaminase/D-cysteine desulfhydrase-like pyridoxal-dependent ACC family enzyme